MSRHPTWIEELPATLLDASSGPSWCGFVSAPVLVRGATGGLQDARGAHSGRSVKVDGRTGHLKRGAWLRWAASYRGVARASYRGRIAVTGARRVL